MGLRSQSDFTQLTRLLPQLHRHALSNSKRGDANDTGKLDDEVVIISNKVRNEPPHPCSGPSKRPAH